MDLHLSNKTALVTGSTAGIGLEIARKLAVEGAKVIVTGRNQAKLDQAVDSIRVSGGARVSGVLADASGKSVKMNSIEIKDGDRERGGVLSAFGWPGRISQGMLERNWGRIIFISSKSGLVTPGEMIHYGMTKTAQLAVSRSCGADQRHEGDGKFCAARPDAFRRHYRLSEKHRERSRGQGYGTRPNVSSTLGSRSMRSVPNAFAGLYFRRRNARAA